MGAAVAALAASAGLDVVLLDVKGQDDPVGPARRGLQRAAQQRAFLDPQAISRIQLGNVVDDLSLLAQCDWVLEAIIEDREAKRDLFRKLAQILPPSVIVTTNTSTFTLQQLLPADQVQLRKNFFVTHFFNPPRALLLCEVTAFPEGEGEQFFGFVRFLERRLGRRVLLVRDTPGFVANRFGIYALAHAVRLTTELGLAPEEVDALTGPLLGRPRSATFRTIDLTGLDIFVLGTRSLQDSTGDDYSAPDWIVDLYQAGRLGDKTGGGIFRRQGEQQWTYDPLQQTDRPFRPAAIPGLDELLRQPFPQRLVGALELPSPYGDYVRHLLGRTFGYVLERTTAAARDLASVDRALEWGFGWAAGPYHQMDFLGLERLRSLLVEAGRSLPPLFDLASQHGGFFVGDQVLDPTSGGLLPVDQLPSARRTFQIQRREALDRAGLRDLGDGVLALRVRSLEEVPNTVETALAQYPAAVVLLPAFDPIGYPLDSLLRAGESAEQAALEETIATIQQVFQFLAAIPVPLVVVLDGEGRGAATTLALWADGAVAYLTTPLGYPGAERGFVPLAVLPALRLRYESALRGVEESQRGRVAVAGAARVLLESGKVDSAIHAGILGLLGERWIATADRDGLLDTAAVLARSLAASVPTRSVREREPLAAAGSGEDWKAQLAVLETSVQAVWEELVQALATAGTMDDLLQAERQVLARALRNPSFREIMVTLRDLVTTRR